ncbi:MAG: LuxR C-terminal-related transcriptional regulator [Sporichthyaceae bacterium]
MGNARSVLHGDVLEQLRLAELLGPGSTAEASRSSTPTEPSRPDVLAARLVEAVQNGTPLREVAGKLGRLAALSGDRDGALRLADLTLADDSAPDRDIAVTVAAAVLAGRGLLSRSAALHRWYAGRDGAATPAAVPALLGTGDLAGARTAFAGSGGALPTCESATQALIAEGLLESVQGAPSAALSMLARAARLLEPMGRSVLLADSPAALTAVVALNCAEFDVADSVLTGAARAEVGGPFTSDRHRVLRAWTAMQRGDLTRARDLAAAPSGVALEPREELMAAAIEVGIARRDGDLGALLPAWQRARQAIVRHPVDLFSLHPLGELAVAAARLEEERWIAPHLAEAWAILAALGRPALWSTPLHWYAVQAAVMSARPSDAEPHVTALESASAANPQAGVLADAARCWLALLDGRVDAAAVQRAARALHNIGHAWDASRLAGQAAVRASDRSDMAILLSCARSLRPNAAPVFDEPAESTSTTAATSPSGSPTSERAAAVAGPRRAPDPRQSEGLGLSERERDVARLLVDGLTYKEIGATLFISAKTVEHHIARIRHRIGAATRGELFSRLRAELAAG